MYKIQYIHVPLSIMLSTQIVLIVSRTKAYIGDRNIIISYYNDESTYYIVPRVPVKMKCNPFRIQINNYFYSAYNY